MVVMHTKRYCTGRCMLSMHSNQKHNIERETTFDKLDVVYTTQFVVRTYTTVHHYKIVNESYVICDA